MKYMTSISKVDATVLRWHTENLGVFESLNALIRFKRSDEIPHWCVVLTSYDALLITPEGMSKPTDEKVGDMIDSWHWHALSDHSGWIGLPSIDDDGAVTFLSMLDCLSTSLSVNKEPATVLPITQALKRLHAITATSELSLAQKIDRILGLGCELLQLPFGIVSRVKHRNYRVKYCCSPNGELAAGATFDLGDCYCVHTLERDQVTGFYHAGLSEIATHPCYEVFKLEAYLGVSIHVAGHVWGTLNFSSPEPRQTDFSDDEYEMVKLFGQWIGEELTRERAAHVLSKAEHQQRLILGSVHDGVIGLNEQCVITFANASAASITGYDIEQLVGMPIGRLIANHSAPDLMDLCPVKRSCE